MSKGEDQFSKNLAKLEALLVECKEAVRDGHTLLKDLKQERKGIEEFKKQMQQEMQAWLDSSVDEHIVPVLQKSFGDLKPQIDSLYKRVESQVGILCKPLEAAQPLIEQNSKQIGDIQTKLRAACLTLDKIEASGILNGIKHIGELLDEDDITEANIVAKLVAAGVPKQQIVEELARAGVEVHHFRGSGDHVEYIWDEEKQGLRMKTADDET